ncbi:MAG: Fe-S protein assembly co-chaperone HscB [Casimicrobiaceae bacterium]
MAVDHFAVFGIPPAYAVDLEALATRYRELQQAVHPDRHAGASPAEQQLAMARALEVNAAWHCLRDPVNRALHLLELAGVDALDPAETAMPTEFLMRQIEWREQLAEAAGDEAALAALDREMTEALNTEIARFSASYPADLDTARDAARKMRFIERQREAVEQELSALA